MTLVTTAFGIRYEHLVLNNNIYIYIKKKSECMTKHLLKKHVNF